MAQLALKNPQRYANEVLDYYGELRETDVTAVLGSLRMVYPNVPELYWNELRNFIEIKIYESWYGCM